ncbi:MAG TPA: hypothetical protein VJ859_08270 [Allosphingosinicella sp.]|nr:hypothetical protein [Allosphingosinicella sp.]
MADDEFKMFIPDQSEWKKQYPSDIKMSPQEMIDFNLEHSRKFMEGDIDGIMEHSIIDNPVWEFYPNRIRVTGKEAIRRYHELNYKIVIEQIDPRNFGGDTREFYSTTTSENTLTHEFSSMYTRKDGTQFRGYTIAVIPYQDGKMVGERIYLDKEMGAWFEESLDEDFFKLSGVERF